MPHQCTGCGHVFEDGSKEMLSGCPDCGGNTFQFRPAGETDSPAEGGETPSPSEQPAPPDGETGSVAETVGRATTKMRDLVASSSPSSSTPDPDAEWPDDAPESPNDLDPSGSGGDTSEIAPGDADELPTGDGEIIDADARREDPPTAEDVAQASARSDVVSPEELGGAADGPEPGASPSPGNTDSTADSPAADPPAADTPAADTATDPSAPETPADGEVVSEPTDEDPDLTELREQLNDQFESIRIVEPGQYELNLMELYDREEYIIALQENGRYVIQVPEQWMGEDPDER